MKYFCPVCGYDSLTAPPANYSICPCCGTEFGYDDVNRTWPELRELWLRHGARWFSGYTRAPEGWNASDQVARLAEQSVSTDSTFSDPLPLQGFALLPATISVDAPRPRVATTTEETVVF